MFLAGVAEDCRIVRRLGHFEVKCWDDTRQRNESKHCELSCRGIYRRGLPVPIEWVKCEVLRGWAELMFVSAEDVPRDAFQVVVGVDT
jgi:hypothetical protein